MPLGTHFKEDLKPVAGYEVPAPRHERITRRPATVSSPMRATVAKAARSKADAAKVRAKARHSKRPAKSLAPHRRSRGTVGTAPQLAKE